METVHCIATMKLISPLHTVALCYASTPVEEQVDIVARNVSTQHACIIQVHLYTVSVRSKQAAMLDVDSPGIEG